MTCSRCGNPADTLYGTGFLCAPCDDILLGHARALVHLEQYGTGIMRPVGCLRPDHGPGWAECECSACGATAVAIISEPCAWCERSLERQIGWQRDKLIHPELPDPDDTRYESALHAWVERLAVAVKADILSEDEARRAIQRRTHDRAA